MSIQDFFSSASSEQTEATHSSESDSDESIMELGSTAVERAELKWTW